MNDVAYWAVGIFGTLRNWIFYSWNNVCTAALAGNDPFLGKNKTNEKTAKTNDVFMKQKNFESLWSAFVFSA